jgi:penicillin-binding protein 2B
MEITRSLRIRIISIVLILVTILILFKLYHVQVVKSAAYISRAEDQYISSSRSLYERGSIFFQNREGDLVPAATLKTGFTLSINPMRLENPDDLYEKLKPFITLERDSFLARARKSDDPYEEIGKRLEKEQKAEIESLEERGVYLHKDRWRYYPGGATAAHVVGFVGFNGDKLEGRYGVESVYEDVLERTDSNLYVNFFAEIFSNLQGVLLKKGDARGGDVVLTIEPTVQAFLEKKLEEVNRDITSRYAGGIILNPQNGEIQAMALNPVFDLNDFRNVESASVFTNRLVENVFEMGSTMKPITMAAGIDSGVITADTLYDDKGFVTVSGAKISNHDKKARGIISMQEVLNQSLNTGAAYVVSEMGNDLFKDYLFRFGLNEKTEIDLPNEAQGLLGNLESGYDVEYATAAFGQGIAVTPVTMTKALAALGNGGYEIHPHVVREIRRSGLPTEYTSLEKGDSVIKESTSEEITRMLVEATDEALVGGTIKFERHSVAAKTGTAQIPDPQGGGYLENTFFHSFFGYFPAYEPEFLIFLFAYDPNTFNSAETWAEPFQDMVSFIINYYEVAPDR